MSEVLHCDIEAIFNRPRAAAYHDGDDLPKHRMNGSDHYTDHKRTNGANKRRSQRRFEEFNSFVDATMGDLLQSELLVWLVLFRDARDGVARTSRVDIARRAKVSEKTVTRAIASLIKRKLVQLLFRGGINKGVSRYAVFPTNTRDITVSR